MMPLASVMKALSKDAGVPIEATTSISSLKATVLVKDQPIGVVMARLADVFHGEWRQSGDLYRLSIPSDWSTKESSFIRAEDEARRKQAEATLRGLMAGTNVSYEQVLKELNEGKASPKRQEELTKVQTPGAYLLGYTFSHLSNSQWQTFWAGKPVRASVVVPVPTSSAQTPGSVNGGIRSVGGQGPAARPRHGRSSNQTDQDPAAPQVMNVRVYASFNPLTGELKSSEPGVGSGSGASGGLVAHSYPEGDLAGLPYGKEVLAWNQVESDSSALKANVSGIPPQGSYFGGQYSLGDILTWLHEKTNVSIVADAFRIPVRPINASGTVANFLTSLANTNRDFVRTDNGFVMIRHGGFWRLKKLELPEDAYQRIEAAKPAKLDDYALFAASLKPEQTLVFRMPNAVLTRFDPEPLRVGMPALRFYATLGSSERQAAVSGQAIGFGHLSGSAREQFLEALGDPSGIPVGTANLNPEDPKIASALGFLMGSTTSERMVASGALSGRRAVGFARRMLFGTTPQDGVQYLIPVD